jgi:hypothetical protein
MITTKLNKSNQACERLAQRFSRSVFYENLWMRCRFKSRPGEAFLFFLFFYYFLPVLLTVILITKWVSEYTLTRTCRKFRNRSYTRIFNSNFNSFFFFNFFGKGAKTSLKEPVHTTRNPKVKKTNGLQGFLL